MWGRVELFFAVVSRDPTRTMAVAKGVKAVVPQKESFNWGNLSKQS